MLNFVYGDMVGSYLNHFNGKKNFSDFKLNSAGIGSNTVLLAASLDSINRNDISIDVFSEWVFRFGDQHSSGSEEFGINFGPYFYELMTHKKGYKENVDTNRYFPIAYACGLKSKTVEEAQELCLRMLELFTINEITINQTMALSAIFHLVNLGHGKNGISMFLKHHLDCYIDLDLDVNSSKLDNTCSSSSGLSESLIIGLGGYMTNSTINRIANLGGDIGSNCAIASACVNRGKGGNFFIKKLIQYRLNKINKKLNIITKN
jgi:hypothetical protein